MTSTPCCFVRPDGKVQAVINAVRQGPTPRGGRVERHTFLAPASVPVLLQRSATFSCDPPQPHFPVDDHFEFYHQGAYYAVVKDHGERLTQHGVSLLLLKSDDGILWDLASSPLVTHFQLCWEDGEVHNYERLEMPRVLFQNGRPSALNLSAYPGGEQKAFNIRPSLLIPIQVELPSRDSTGDIRRFIWWGGRIHSSPLRVCRQTILAVHPDIGNGKLNGFVDTPKWQ